MTGAIEFMKAWRGICNATPENFVEVPLLVHMVNEVYKNELPKN